MVFSVSTTGASTSSCYFYMSQNSVKKKKNTREITEEKVRTHKCLGSCHSLILIAHYVELYGSNFTETWQTGLKQQFQHFSEINHAKTISTTWPFKTKLKKKKEIQQILLQWIVPSVVVVSLIFIFENVN